MKRNRLNNKLRIITDKCQLFRGILLNGLKSKFKNQVKMKKTTNLQEASLEEDSRHWFQRKNKKSVIIIANLKKISMTWKNHQKATWTCSLQKILWCKMCFLKSYRKLERMRKSHYLFKSMVICSDRMVLKMLWLSIWPSTGLMVFM